MMHSHPRENVISQENAVLLGSFHFFLSQAQPKPEISMSKNISIIPFVMRWPLDLIVHYVKYRRLHIYCENVPWHRTWHGNRRA
jgi:hypothetical protein